MRFAAVLCLAGVLTLPTIGDSATAQPWPSRPITVISPFSAGSGVDLLARHVANALSEHVHQPVIVDDRPGANGNVGAAAAAKADPDGYTLLIETPGIAVQNKFVYKSMPFDADHDFVPIVLIAKAPMLVLVNPKLPVHTLAELLDYSKTYPGKVSVSSIGIGSQPHITLEMLNRLSGAGMVHVPYNNATQQNMDLIGGQVEASINYVTTSLGFVIDGKVRALAITSKIRMQRLPDVPTLEESGFPGFESVGWYAVVAPRGTSAEVTAKINAVVNEYIATDAGKQHLDELGMQASGGTPEDVTAWIKLETERWGPIVKAAVPN
jgi:tripartite-type tricarboxylate transporter receptor subunit TctC